MNDPKFLGIPNICFSLTEKNDEREIQYSEQRIETGFDDSETWSLNCTISNFILPRLKRFKELSEERTIRNNLHKDLNIIIIAFELVVRDNGCWIWTEIEEKQVNKGLKLFRKNFFKLWW